MDLNVFVEFDRPLEFNERANGVKVFPNTVDLTHVVVGERAEIFGNCGIEIRQVVRIKNDLLSVHFGVADAKRPGKIEVGLGQGLSLFARVDDPGHAWNDFILANIQKTCS